MEEWLCGLVHALLIFMRCWVLAGASVALWYFISGLVR